MITGSIVALVTPMQWGAEGEAQVDEPALKRLVDWHVESGTDAIVSVGTTGESATLNFQEHVGVIQKTVEYAAGRIPVIAGTGANSTQEAIELTAAAKQAGADACLLVTPYYNKPTQEGLYQHHKAIAEAVDIPQILYNVPGRTACDMSPQTAIRLSSIKNIVGIKEATAELDRIDTLKAATSADFAIYSGDDATALAAIARGAHGDISVTANVHPAAMAKMCRAALEGRIDEAQQLNAPLMALHETLFVETSPSPVKWALEQMGKIGPAIRLPLLPLSQESQPVVLKALQSTALLPQVESEPSA